MAQQTRALALLSNHKREFFSYHSQSEFESGVISRNCLTVTCLKRYLIGLFLMLLAVFLMVHYRKGTALLYN